MVEDSDVKIVNGGDDLLLDDDEEEVVVRRARVGRRFVIEDEEASEEEEEEDEVEEVSSSEEDEGGEGGDGDEDVVGKALQKCAKISADLRKELYGSSSGVTTCDRYSEVESSTVRIVTQVVESFTALRVVMCAVKRNSFAFGVGSLLMISQTDIDEACKAEDSDFQPILKPYQLVGVNFLLLLYKKGIEGGNDILLVWICKKFIL